MFKSLVNQLASIALAVIFAFIVWSVATTEENPSREAVLPEAVPIEVANLPPNLILYQKSGDNVRLKIGAPAESWAQLHATSFRAVADLAELPAGLHQVTVRVESANPVAHILEIDPPALTVRLENLKTIQADVQAEVLDEAPLGYIAKVPTLTPARVKISGPEVIVDQVSAVVAPLLIRGSKTPIERAVTLVARDAEGNALQGLTISPPAVSVSLPIEQRVGYKDVAVKAVLRGNVLAGFWISNITVDPSTATVVGSPDMLTKIPGFVETAPVDITGAKEDVVKRVALALPEGVSVLSDSGVQVRVAVTPIMGGQTVRRTVTLSGLTRDLLATISPDAVEVILSGPLPTLASLTTGEVQVVVDVLGLSPGTYQLKPRVILIPDGLKVESIVPDTVEVEISPQ